MTLGERIKDRRTALGLSQEYVADQLGISRQAVAKWETGKSRPSAANLVSLAELLEVSLSQLTGAEAEEPSPEPRQSLPEEREKARKKNARMLVGRFFGMILVNAGWDGYSSGLYADLPAYWLAILAAGLLLVFRTSLDMVKRRRMEGPQVALGAGLMISIFFLPGWIPSSNPGFRYFLSDVAAIPFLCALNLKYWRHIWPVKEPVPPG